MTGRRPKSNLAELLAKPLVAVGVCPACGRRAIDRVARREVAGG